MIEDFELSTAEELGIGLYPGNLSPGWTPAEEAQYVAAAGEPRPIAEPFRPAQIQQLEHEIAEQSLAILRLSTQQAFAKKLRDTLTEKLRQLKDDDGEGAGSDDQDDEEDDDDSDDSEWVTDDGVKQGVVDPAAETSISKASPSDSPNAWRSVTVEQLGLKESICKALRENPERTIATLGDIADWSAAPSLKQLIDIPKIGESKASAIIAACDAYWAKNPQPEVQGALGTVGQALQEAGVTPTAPEGASPAEVKEVASV